MDNRLTLLVLRRRARRKESRKGPGQWLFRITGGLVLMALLSLVGFGVAGVATAAGVYAYFARGLPDAGLVAEVDGEFETT